MRAAHPGVRTKGDTMSMTATPIDDEDFDAIEHIGRPYWFERHPSQAEGEDI